MVLTPFSSCFQEKKDKNPADKGNDGIDGNEKDGPIGTDLSTSTAGLSVKES
jgi:hypothetical protein